MIYGPICSSASETLRVALESLARCSGDPVGDEHHVLVALQATSKALRELDNAAKILRYLSATRKPAESEIVETEDDQETIRYLRELCEATYTLSERARSSLRFLEHLTVWCLEHGDELPLEARTKALSALRLLRTIRSNNRSRLAGECGPLSRLLHTCETVLRVYASVERERTCV